MLEEDTPTAISIEMYDAAFSFLRGKMSVKDICKELNLAESTFHYNLKIRSLNANRRMVGIKAIKYIQSNFNASYDTVFKKFIIQSGGGQQQLHDGYYYGYFKFPNKETIGYFILNVNGIEINLWSQAKKCKGEIYYNKDTFRIVLHDSISKSQSDFFIGKDSQNPKIKFMISLWVNIFSEVYSTLCALIFVGPLNIMVNKDQQFHENTDLQNDIKDKLDLKVRKYILKQNFIDLSIDGYDGIE